MCFLAPQLQDGGELMPPPTPHILTHTGVGSISMPDVSEDVYPGGHAARPSESTHIGVTTVV